MRLAYISTVLLALASIEFNSLADSGLPAAAGRKNYAYQPGAITLIDMEKKNAGDAPPEICVIYSTVPPSRSADLAQRLLEKNLVACVSITPVRSLYRWEGKSCDDEEHLLVIKTRRSLAETVIRALKAMHPYEVPEIIVLPVISGHAPYLDWVYRRRAGHDLHAPRHPGHCRDRPGRPMMPSSSRTGSSSCSTTSR